MEQKMELPGLVSSAVIHLSKTAEVNGRGVVQ